MATGLRLRPGDAFQVSYAVPGPAKTVWTSMQPAAVRYQLGADLSTVSTTVPNATFPTIVTHDNFFDIAAALAFPIP